MDYTFILFIIVLFILTGYNYYYLRYFRRKSNNDRKIEEKDNYFKLDAKIELQKYLALGLIAIAAFFGYTKFTDINKDLEKVDDIEITISKLKSDYQTLNTTNSELSKNLNKQIETFNSKIIKLNKELETATKKIPEDNLRVLAESLIRTRIEFMANIGRWSAKSYSKEEIQDEINRSMDSLIRLGFSENEIDQIRNGLEKDIESLKF